MSKAFWKFLSSIHQLIISYASRLLGQNIPFWETGNLFPHKFLSVWPGFYSLQRALPPQQGSGLSSSPAAILEEGLVLSGRHYVVQQLLVLGLHPLGCTLWAALMCFPIQVPPQLWGEYHHGLKLPAVNSFCFKVAFLIHLPQIRWWVWDFP